MVKHAIPAVILTTLFAVAMGSAQAEVFRWKDKDGKVHYSDNPPKDVQAEKRKVGDNKIESDKASYETKRAMQLAPVTLYSFSDCKEPCDQARKFLTTRKVPFTESVMKTKEEFDAVAKLVGKKEPTAPTLLVGSKPVEGFEAGAWNSMLDVVGYPKAP